MYKRILLPTDGSEATRRAVAYGIGFARAIGAGVVAMTVSAPVRLVAADGEMPIGTADQYAAACRRAAQRLLDEVRAQAQAAGLDCSAVQIVSDDVHEAILRAAREHGCDLILMASHGRRGFKALMPGSVTQKVLVHSTIPVLVYR
ncbi:universal stress protein [Massilia sp. MS-15]|uniref:universal stress protein n=1 Tax=Massilia sp. MS-15 TaxID=2878200 RepID=UPI001CD6C0B1|nr:universal stress protein [Massilia sp. MS-15]MCA1246119.1 universal stress protein [Massilia sp. MS-15]